jgi:uncharacterized membrane protein YfcA
MNLALIAVAMLVGVSIGMVGVGGLLLPPALQTLGGLSLHASMATALFTFIFTGIAGTVLFQRRGSIDWRVAIPLCAGGALFGFVGAQVNGVLDARPLALMLAVLILVSGVYTLCGAAASTHISDGRRHRTGVLLLIGSFAGFCSGLVGVGGPAVSVPLLVLAGYPALVAIGASQVIQILAATSGSLVHVRDGTIDFEFATWLTLVELVGVGMGTWLAHAVGARVLKRCVGLLCSLVGAALLVKVW